MSLHKITWKTKVKYIVFSIYGKDDIRWPILLNKEIPASYCSLIVSQMSQMMQTLTFSL